MVIEPQVSGLGWETHISKWRQIAPGKRKFQKILDHWRYILSLTGIYILIVITCFFLLITTDTEFLIKLMGVVGIILCLEAYRYLSKVLSSSGEYEEIFLRASKSIEKKENEQSDNKE